MRVGINALGAITQDTGGRTYLYYFIKTLASMRRADTFVLFVSSEREDLWGNLPSNFVRVIIPFTALRSSLKVLGEQLALPVVMRRYRLEAMYYPGNFLAPLGMRKNVVAIRSLLYYHYPDQVGPLRLAYRKLLSALTVRLAYRIIVPSADAKEDVVRFLGADPDQIVVIPHGIDARGFQRPIQPEELKTVLGRYGLAPGGYLLFVSALWPYKGLDTLLKAYALCRQRRTTTLRLAIVGKGIAANASYRETLDLVRQLGQTDHVAFLGHCDHDELRYLYRGAAAFVLPSRYESFGHPLLEAMASGTPVISARRHAIPEVVGDAAVLIDPDNVDDLAESIQRVLDDSALRTALVQKGHERVKMFSWERAVRQTLEVIQASARS